MQFNQEMVHKLIKTAKRWNIPENVAHEVIRRDTKCIYCGITFDDTIRSQKASWEHVVNDIRLNSSDNIALCCVGCNASKGSKELNIWLESKGAIKRDAKFPEFLKNL